MTCCCKGNEDENVKHKQRDEQEKKALMTRLSRIEGQVRGIRAMVEDDRYCVDILTQVSAIQAALNGFNKELLARHIKTCVSEDIREGNEEAVDELMKGFAEEDEVIVLTDLTSGSVNQQFFRYRNRPHTHIVSGMNLPLALTTVLMKDNMDKEMLPQAVLGEAHEALKEFKLASDDDEEDDI